jgi:parvulin-like peptidyl-prolyl isomerase
MKRFFATGLIAFCITIFLLSIHHVRADEKRSEEAPKVEEKKEQSGDELLKAKKESLESAKKIIVAKVNGVPITMYQVVKMMNLIGPKMGTDVESVKKEAINKLIIQELAYQRAKSLNVSVEKKNVDEAIENAIENMGGEEGFKKFLESEAMTEDEYRKHLERLFAVEIIYARDVIDKAVVPEDKLKEEYEKLKDRLILPEKVGVIDVYFLKTDKATFKNAQNILKKIKSDKDKDPWKLVLDGTFIVRALDIKKDKHKELYNSAKKLKVGQISNVIKTPTGLHILKLVEYSPERPATLEETRSYLESRLKPIEVEKRFKEWSEELKKDAKIEILEEK